MHAFNQTSITLFMFVFTKTFFLYKSIVLYIKTYNAMKNNFNKKYKKSWLDSSYTIEGKDKRISNPRELWNKIENKK